MDDLVKERAARYVQERNEALNLNARQAKKIAALEAERDGWKDAYDRSQRQRAADAARIRELEAMVAEAGRVVANLMPLARNDRYLIQHPHYEDAEALLARMKGDSDDRA